MQRVSYILTWRQGQDAERRDNLLAVLAWLARYPAFEPIVVEQDDAPRLGGPPPDSKCTYVFAYNPGPFNKSWGLNVGFRVSRQPWLAFADGDLILGDALREALDHVGRGYQTIKPYRHLVDLDAGESARVRAGEFDWLPARDPAAAPDREAAGEQLSFAGGAFLVTRAAFAHVGGWDERFRGWGGEDDAMSYKLERARASGVELDRRPALHLHHARPASATTAQPHYAANCALLAGYRQLDDAQLARFAELQMQLIGRQDKYRPR
jgi:glycosyl transferase family 7 (putative galactosyltransferase)